MHYPINEIFATIQGEATYTGMPAVFVRVQGCPVGCPWCDTKYTWEVKDAQQNLSAADILNEISHYPERHVVITGGEPCLYDLGSLTTTILESGRSVQIETSGVYPIQVPETVWVTVSPKINMPGGSCQENSVLRANEIKMPIGKQRDIDSLMGLPIKNKLVWLQPLSQNLSATNLCMESAARYGWRVSFQAHKFVGLR